MKNPSEASTVSNNKLSATMFNANPKQMLPTHTHTHTRGREQKRERERERERRGRGEEKKGNNPRQKRPNARKKGYNKCNKGKEQKKIRNGEGKRNSLSTTPLVEDPTQPMIWNWMDLSPERDKQRDRERKTETETETERTVLLSTSSSCHHATTIIINLHIALFFCEISPPTTTNPSPLSSLLFSSPLLSSTFFPSPTAPFFSSCSLF